MTQLANTSNFDSWEAKKNNKLNKKERYCLSRAIRGRVIFPQNMYQPLAPYLLIFFSLQNY